MGKYVLLSMNKPMTMAITILADRWISTHCLYGLHDYGYSDMCSCWCHNKARGVSVVNDSMTAATL